MNLVGKGKDVLSGTGRDQNRNLGRTGIQQPLRADGERCPCGQDVVNHDNASSFDHILVTRVKRNGLPHPLHTGIRPQTREGACMSNALQQVRHKFQRLRMYTS